MLLPLPTFHPLALPGGKFGVSRAETYDPAAYDPTGWYASRKLNGVRCVIHLKRGERPRCYTRTGREITGLDALEAPLQAAFEHPDWWNPDIVLDGELSLATRDGADDFAGIVSAIQRKDYVIPNPRFHAFDLLTGDEFRAGRTPREWLARRSGLCLLLGLAPSRNITPLTQTPLTGPDHLAALVAQAAANGWEGLVLRNPDAPYRAGPDENTLKVKRWHDLECRVLSPLILEGGLVGVRVQHGATELTITNGFSVAQRILYGQHPDRLIGAEITIAFSPDSLNDPRVIAVYEGGRPD